MKQYKIVYTEKLGYEFFVSASSKEQAIDMR